MSVGAVTVTSRRRRRGVSVALSVIAPPARGGSASSAAPVRPRIANRSSSVASTVPSASAMVTATGMTRPYSVSVGRRRRCGDGQFGLGLGHRRQQVRGVVQMHQAQQALDDREAVVGGRRTDGGEHRRPAAADEGIGHQGHSRRQRRAERSGDTGVVGDLLGIPVDRDLGGVVMHRRQRIGSVDAGGDRKHGAHRGRRVLDGDDRHAAVDRAGRQRESDVDPDVGQRNTQRHHVTAIAPAGHRWTGVWHCGFR